MKMLRPITMTDSILLSTDVPETDHAEYVAGTTYSIGEYCIVVATHKIYEALQSSNTGNYPPDNLTGTTPYWLEYGATAPWKMFDGVVGSQTEQGDSITISFVSSLASGVALLNMEGTEVTVTMTHAVDGEVLNETYDLISESNVVDASTYFFEPFYLTENVLVNLVASVPPYVDAVVEITITNLGGTAKLGEVVPGKIAFLGDTQKGGSAGITDYSTKVADAFGNYSIVPRPYSKRGSYNLHVPTAQVEFLMTALAQYRSTAVVWIPTDACGLSSPLILYGYYRDFDVSLSYEDRSFCTLELEGLT